jgi:methionyl-tRNA formyltransferase
MLAQEAIDILPDETAGELEARLAPLGAHLAMQVIDRMAEGPVRGVKQDPAQVTRAPKLKKEMGLIDWSKPAVQVWNQIRAMQPWPTAYTFLHAHARPPVRVIIADAASAPVKGHGGPGELFADQTEDGEPILAVNAGDGPVLRVLMIQPAGKRAMTAAEFLRGHPVQPGDRFGPENV